MRQALVCLRFPNSRPAPLTPSRPHPPPTPCTAPHPERQVDEGAHRPQGRQLGHHLGQVEGQGHPGHQPHRLTHQRLAVGWAAAGSGVGGRAGKGSRGQQEAHWLRHIHGKAEREGGSKAASRMPAGGISHNIRHAHERAHAHSHTPRSWPPSAARRLPPHPQRALPRRAAAGCRPAGRACRRLGSRSRSRRPGRRPGLRPHRLHRRGGVGGAGAQGVRRAW